MTTKFATHAAADLVTRSGFRFLVRTAGPDDGAALTALFDHMTKDDLRFRFLSAVRKVSPKQIEDMTHVDHIRTEDFLAFEPGSTRIIANAMLAADKKLEVAEFAIAVDSDFKDRGIEAALLEHVIRCRGVLHQAAMAHRALGCSGATRVDLIVSPTGNEYLLEVNTVPGMTRESLLPKIAAAAGLSFEDLAEAILLGAQLHVADGGRSDRRRLSQRPFAGEERRTLRGRALAEACLDAGLGRRIDLLDVGDGAMFNPLTPFLEAIRDGRPSPLPLREALPAHELVDAIYASADDDGRPRPVSGGSPHQSG